MEASPETTEEEGVLSFSFIFCCSFRVAYLCLLFMRLTAQNIITIGKIIIESSTGYEALIIRIEISTVWVDSNLRVLTIVSTIKIRGTKMITAIKKSMNGSNSFLKK